MTDLDSLRFFPVRHRSLAPPARAVKKAFNPDKINYAAFGDLLRHLHFHLVPKYKDEFEWGGTFVMNPEKKPLNNAECAEAVARIRDALR